MGKGAWDSRMGGRCHQAFIFRHWTSGKKYL
jgi:hypothetical protein